MRQVYKIPDNLAKSVGDMEIVLSSAKSDFAIRPMPIKYIIAYIVIIVGGIYLVEAIVNKNQVTFIE